MYSGFVILNHTISHISCLASVSCLGFSAAGSSSETGRPCSSLLTLGSTNRIGSAIEEKRFFTVPSWPIKNFSKFHCSHKGEGSGQGKREEEG